MKVSSSHAVKGIALLASVVALAGCNQGGENDKPHNTEQPSSVVTKTSTATRSSESPTVSKNSSSAAKNDEHNAAEVEDGDGKPAAQRRKLQESCTQTTAAQEYQTHVADVPPPPWGQWDSNLSSFLDNQPCATLSWTVLVPTEIGDGNPPTQTMLFHNGRFIKTVSPKTTYPPSVSRVDDSTITVTWEWPKPGEPMAAPTGRSVATFRWDDQSESVIMEGELPPN